MPRSTPKNKAPGIFGYAQSIGLNFTGDKDAPSSAKDRFRMNDWLREKGATFKGLNPENPDEFIAADIDGNERVIPTKEILLAEGFKEDEIPSTYVQFNTPESPLNISPLSGKERLGKATGNKSGIISSLKQEYDGILQHPDHGLLVNNKGVWQKVDPTGLGDGDGYQKTKELMKDAVDLTDVGMDMVISGLPTAYAGAIGGPAAAIKVGAATQALSTGIRTSLGRALGTYVATPEQQLSDMAIETAMAAAGEKYLPGVKPAAQKFLKGIRSFNTKLPDAVKAPLKAMVQRFAFKNDAGATDTIFESPGSVIARYKDAAKGSSKEGSVIAHLDRKLVSVAEKTMEAAEDGLNKEWTNGLRDIKKAVGETNFAVNMDAFLRTLPGKLEAAGIGKLAVEQAQDGAGKKFTKTSLKPFSANEKNLRRIRSGDIAELDEQAMVAVNKVLDSISDMSKMGTLRGDAAANALSSIHREINASLKSVIKSGQSSNQAKMMASRLRAIFSEQVAEQFQARGLGKEYRALNAKWGQYNEAIAKARKQLDMGEGGLERFVAERVVSPSVRARPKGAVQTADDAIKALVPGGEKMLQELKYLHAAKRLAPNGPQLGLGGALSAAVTPGLALGLGAGPVTTAALAAGAVSQSFPRVASKEALMAKKLNRYVVGLNHMLRNADKKTLESIFQDGSKTQELLRTAFQGVMREQRLGAEFTKGMQEMLSPIFPPSPQMPALEE